MMQGSSEAYYWHSKAVTGVCALLYAEVGSSAVPAPSSTGRSMYHQKVEVSSAIIATVSRDANL